LVNIEQPPLRCRLAVQNLVAKALANCDMGLHGDIIDPPTHRLASRRPLWIDMKLVDIKRQWQEDWQTALVVNDHLVHDPAIRQPDLNLRRKIWSALNQYRTAQVTIEHATRGLASSDLCDCGEIQTMSPIVDSCTSTRLDGGL